MLAGPVFQVELLTTARRARYYAIRALYVMVLLFVLFSTYESFFVNQTRGGGGEVPVRLMNFFGTQLFYTFSLAQGITVCLLTPALVAGTLAVEKQRKTLLYLLASDLSSVDIVLGKLAARLLHLFVFILLGLPIFSLLQYFGGIEPWMIAAVYGMTFSAAIFIAGLSMYASVIARRGRDAIIMTYLLMLAYYFMPFLIGGLLSVYFPETVEFLAPAFIWVYPGVGLFVATMQTRAFGMGWVSSTTLFCWSLALLWIYGLGFVAFAAWRLRPIAAKGEGKQRQRIGLDNRGRMTVRVIPKPPVSESNPMLWKERYTSRIGGWARLGVGFGQLFLLTGIGCLAFEGVWESVREMFYSGFFPTDFDRNRQSFNAYIRGVTSIIFVLWLIGTAFSAASSVSGEREEDTWLSLISTVLTGREILRAKRRGAILRYKGMGIVLLVLWGIALATGSVHPIGLLAATALFAASLAFTSSLGVFLSLRSKSTMRALGITLAPLIFLNGGFMLCCLTPFSPNGNYNRAYSAIPFVLAYDAPISYHDSTWLFADPSNDINVYNNGYFGSNAWDDYPMRRSELRLALVFYCISVPAYSIAAFLLARLADRRFAAAAERPMLPGIEPDLEEDEPTPPREKPSAGSSPWDRPETLAGGPTP